MKIFVCSYWTGETAAMDVSNAHTHIHRGHTTATTSVLTPGPPGSAGSPSDLLLHLVQQRTIEISGSGFSTNQQCQSTEGKTKHSSRPQRITNCALLPLLLLADVTTTEDKLTAQIFDDTKMTL